MRDQIGVEIALPPSAVRQHGSPADAHVYPARALIARMEVAGLPLAFVACVLIFLGAAGKSAQLPFSAWLPDAMAGPTPVSALIHAATMVTAGVYLFARLGFLFALSPGAVTVVVLVGTVTALGAAGAALFQNDLKRVLAYSTVSQLGYMFAATAGGGSSGIFHVVTHGFFKAALFLAAGVIIHAVEERMEQRMEKRMNPGGGEAAPDEAQDLRTMRELGGLAAALPWTRCAYFVACLALAGFPIASGFYSKDQILAAVATAPNLLVSPPLVLGALAVTSFLTACYAFRSYYFVFSGPRARLSDTRGQPPPAPAGSAPHASAESRLLAGVVLALGLGAVVAGPLLGWPRNWTASHASPALDTFLEPVFAGNFGEVPPIEVPPALEWGLQVGGLAVAVLGWLVARRLYGPRGSLARVAAAPSGALGPFFAGGGGLDTAYRLVAVRPVLALARAVAWLDRRVIDRAVDGVAAAGVTAARFTGLFDRRVVDGAVNGASAGVIAAGRRAARLQSGRLNLYIVLLAAGIAGTVVLVYFFSS
jgi:NADH-quinone oxidoreductase subunit L